MGKRKPHLAGRPPKKTVNTEGEQEQGTVFFYMPNEKPYGIFCQWHASPFSIPIASLQWLVDIAPSSPSSVPTTPSAILSTHATTSKPSIPFTCAEQSYMFCKALYFSDAHTARLILSTPDPKTQKKHGQNVKHFDDHLWSQVKSRVARVGNFYKYSKGNTHMRSVLLGTQGKEIVEAGRRDAIWGIGFKADEAEKYRPFWGQNLLGRCLMDVRDKIIEFDKKMAEAFLEENVKLGLGRVVEWRWRW